MSSNTLLQLDLPGVPKVRSGKVREMFDLGDSLLMLASDRISAYDVVLPNGIPQKGEVLTMFSHFWFDRVADLVPNHLLAKADDPLPEAVSDYAEQMAAARWLQWPRRSPSSVVRGYLAGSGWKEYQTGTVWALSQMVSTTPPSCSSRSSPRPPRPRRSRRKHQLRGSSQHRWQRHRREGARTQHRALQARPRPRSHQGHHHRRHQV